MLKTSGNELMVQQG